MPGDDAETGALAPDTSAYQVSRARTAALIAAAGLATYLGFVAVTRNVFLFDLADVTPLFVALILMNLLLAATARVWASWRRTIYAYEAFQVLMCTVILYRLGGLMMSSLLITYAFPVILAEMFHSNSSVFVIANLSAVCYGALAWVQNEKLAEVGIDAQQQIGFVLMAFLIFNSLAVYTNRYGYQLRNLARHLQEKVAERTAELTAVNRELAAKARALEAKQDELKTFVYTVTHDLKSPLSAILLTADLLLQREAGALGAESREDLERIVRLAGGTEDMIRDLLELFRITSQPEAATWVGLRALVDRALETLDPQIAAKRVRVEVGALPPVWGQPRKLAHVVTNLLSNALKYVPAGRGRVEISGAVENGSALLSVRDNGIGIPEPYHHGIFDLFGRVPGEEQVVDGQAVGGTGVGLAIVKRIVEAHRGSVSVESEPGIGSRFTVRLPAEGGGST
jgi:signal transduction histidine kinase